MISERQNISRDTICGRNRLFYYTLLLRWAAWMKQVVARLQWTEDICLKIVIINVEVIISWFTLHQDELVRAAHFVYFTWPETKKQTSKCKIHT